MKEGRQSFLAKKPVYLRSSYTIVGPKEGDGNFGECFDTVLRDDLWGEKSYEKAESKMHREKQLNRRMEINASIKKLKRELEMF